MAEGGEKKTGSGRRKISRRSFLRAMLLASATITAAGLGYFPVVNASQVRLRPPGAVPENDFLASCIKCGQCVQTCPVEAIELAELDEGFGVGAAYIDARKQACDFSCDALQCVLACPTGALDHQIEKPEQVRMGLAELVDAVGCLGVRGEGFSGHPRGEDYAGLLRYSEIDRWKPQLMRDHPVDVEICDLCERFCPIEGAIKMTPQESGVGLTPVVQPTCTGCGVCEMVCPMEEAAIVIIPWKQWDEKQEAGHVG